MNAQFSIDFSATVKTMKKYTVKAVRLAGTVHAGYRTSHDRANKSPEAAKANRWRRHKSILNLNG